MAVLFQVIGTILLCFSCMNIGIILAWPSSTILLFKSENTTLHRPMTETEISLFGSLPAIGSLLANPVAALILDRLGRKRTTILTTLIFVIGWSIVAISNRVEAILTATVISGCGLAIFLQVCIYVSEISQDSIRGTLTAAPNQFYGFGFLFSYFLGGVLTYRVMVYACLSYAVLSVLLLSLLKESPLSLMAKGRNADAAKSLAFYRRTKSTSVEVVSEMNNIRRILRTKSDSEDARSLTKGEEIVESQVKTKKMSCWQFFKTTPSTRHQFYLVLMLKSALICQGLPVVQVYAEPMFAAAVGDVISPNLCSVVLGLVVLVSGIIGAYLVDVVGRRPLQIYSSIAAGICCAVIGTQMVTELLPKWTTPIFICIYAIFHTTGTGTVAFVILSEVFLPEVKSILSMIAVEWTWVCHFIFLFLFNLLIQWIGLSSIFFIFSFFCFATALYFFYFLPETKGLPVYAIQDLFLKRVKSILSMIAVEWTWVCYFIFLFLFNLLIQWIGLSSIFFIFSFFCFATALYFFYFLPETKGLPVYAIQDLFLKRVK